MVYSILHRGTYIYITIFMYKRFFSLYTYKRPPKRTIPSSYRVPDVLRRVRRDSYCKSTTPYYGGEGNMVMGDGWTGCGSGATRRGYTTISVLLLYYDKLLVLWLCVHVEDVCYYYIII